MRIQYAGERENVPAGKRGKSAGFPDISNAKNAVGRAGTKKCAVGTAFRQKIFRRQTARADAEKRTAPHNKTVLGQERILPQAVLSYSKVSDHSSLPFGFSAVTVGLSAGDAGVVVFGICGRGVVCPFWAAVAAGLRTVVPAAVLAGLAAADAAGVAGAVAGRFTAVPEAEAADAGFTGADAAAGAGRFTVVPAAAAVPADFAVVAVAGCFTVVPAAVAVLAGLADADAAAVTGRFTVVPALFVECCVLIPTVDVVAVFFTEAAADVCAVVVFRTAAGCAAAVVVF